MVDFCRPGRIYGQRVRETEHAASFRPIVMSHCKMRSMKFIQNYHNEHTKFNFGVLIVVILYEFHTLHFSVQLRGLAPEATTFYRRLTSLLASRWGDNYSVVMGWLHCSLSFSLLRSAIAWSSLVHRTFSSCPPPL